MDEIDTNQSKYARWTPPLASRAARKVAVANRGSYKGERVVAKGPSRILKIDSYGEYLSGLCIEYEASVAEIAEQLPPVGYHDADGVVKKHYFDLGATLHDGRRRVYAVKPKRRAAETDFEAELALVAGQWPDGFADQAFLVTEEHYDPIDVFNAKLQHGMRDPELEADAAALAVVSAMAEAKTLGELVAEIGLDGQGYRALVRLITAGVLVLRHRERIGYASVVDRGVSE
ncbi:hypothetical protein [Defluviimonas salinarum]|uniref:TnsA endonuclease N-terminal domain-containing protein n=1 Tax=Defluviimonas salinarum TaxID=2992147 RepID=A0ABT3J7B1_9RHOB|nr:hypothetical protein [Defluviimonas salinarum]MCW3783551.1 hypothetical protein [Defluviimonas salinarum]